MDRGPALQVEGGRELRASLKAAGADLGDLKAAHRAASTLVSAAAAGRAPRRTGTLAASLRPGATQTSALIRGGGARVPYGGPIHWGWPGHNIAPNPFISEAAQATEPTWVEAYRRDVAHIVDSVKGA